MRLFDFVVDTLKQLSHALLADRLTNETSPASDMRKGSIVLFNGVMVSDVDVDDAGDAVRARGRCFLRLLRMLDFLLIIDHY